ncbi:MAG TPA: ABC transporter substrate-binding protein [Burkholderiaceae bacterium]|nr:ABC transporter substrate-binding protein [Burkholderiaceae bacterium]
MPHSPSHPRRTALALLAAGLGSLALWQPALAQENVFRIGLILPMTGQQATTGRQIEAAARLYMAQHGDTVAGKKVQLIVKDDTSLPDQTRRLAQELIVNEKVNVLAGMGITPSAMAVAPLATQSKTPLVVMAAATSSITQASPFIVRTSFTLPQASVALADWANKNGIKTVVSLVSDYGPGIDAEKFFNGRMVNNGDKVIEALRVPMRNPDFAPFLQRVLDVKPDALFVMLPSGPGAALLKQYGQRGLADAGIRLIGHGAITDDDNLNQAGDAALGVITSDYYATAHDSEKNRKFIETYKSIDNTSRPNFFGVAGYDGMHLIYAALEATDGKGKGMALVDAMKNLSFESPRGQVTVDPETRDFIQNIYMRKVEKVGDEYQNVEFDVIERVNARGEAK